ncbi:alpha/beta hydrolase [uncultured Cohaesibacter sp.]|uniref:alpha/beta hydrolase n=1 Tax=uncultured Cohaesibacter sp. TaxID=1002546 RepID=UPI00292EBE2E|nr:alpha/beta hydrolase [uncultured Cohaesibacter sp.]
MTCQCNGSDQAFAVSSRGLPNACGVAVLLCFILAGCASPTGIKFTEPSLTGLDTETVLVATSRSPDELVRADFSGKRDEKLHFSSYDVSIPPSHKTGEIEWPRGDKPDIKRHFAVTMAKDIPVESGFLAALNARMTMEARSEKASQREVILFVHGYNTDFSESLYRAAQMKHDFKLQAPLALFSWPSSGKTTDYLYDRDSVKVSRDKLASVIELLSRTKAQAVTLVAHSMGSELLMESLRQIALENHGNLPKKLKTIILISPDLDVDVFNNQLDAIKTLPADFVLFVSESDRALKLSSRLAGDNTRVGNTIDITKFKRKGIAVIDVTDFTDGDAMNHMSVATSPSLVSLFKGFAGSMHGDLMLAPGEQISLSDQVIDTATLPITLVVRTTKTILNP